MKLSTYDVLRNKNDLADMLNDIQDILNLGLYQTAEQAALPTDTPTEGEARLITTTSPILAYYVNAAWKYLSLTSAAEQSGWSYIAEAAATSVTATVTFPTAFASAPLVFVSYIGSRLISAGTPSGTGWFTGALTLRYAIGYAASTTGFTAGIIQSANSNLDATYNSGFVWRALLT